MSEHHKHIEIDTSQQEYLEVTPKDITKLSTTVKFILGVAATLMIAIGGGIFNYVLTHEHRLTKLESIVDSQTASMREKSEANNIALANMTTALNNMTISINNLKDIVIELRTRMDHPSGK